MKIILNGQERSFEAPLTIAGLLREMDLGERRVAVEVNREIIPRSQHGAHELKDNDRVEVVFAIGGGSASRSSPAKQGATGRATGDEAWR
jgi:sulfur carrier protein